MNIDSTTNNMEAGVRSLLLNSVPDLKTDWLDDLEIRQTL
jgi:hypothetical protein